MDDRKVFVYGTLRRGADHPLAQRLALGRDYLGPAWWRGLLFDLGPYPAAVRHAGHFEVAGDLYGLSDDDLLEALDVYEELGTDAPGRFLRERDEVRCADGSRCTAWVYRYTGPVDARARIQGGDWLQHLTARGKTLV